MNILIGIPTKESIDIEAAISIMNLDWDGHSITYTHADGAGVYGVAQARNMLCRKAIDGQYDKLFMIDSDMIGRIVTFRTTFGHGGPETWSVDPGKNTWFFDKNKAAMGAMADLGIHKTDLVQFLTGQRVVRTTAHVTTLDKRDGSGNLIGVDDNAICIYEMSGGTVGTMTASWTYYGPEDNSTVLYGTKGIMRIYDDPAHSIVVNFPDGTTKYFDVDAIQTNDNQTKSGVIDLWMAALVQNKEPEISGEGALAAMRAVFASLRSSETGCAVEIPENR